MVKSKKLSRGSLAVLLLALLLALSMVVGITGAWFTDSDLTDGSGTTNLGVVKASIKGNDANDKVKVAAVETTEHQFVPGQYIVVGDTTSHNAAVIENEGDVAAYIYYTYTVSLKTVGKALTAISEQGVETWDATATERVVTNLVTASEGADRVFDLMNEAGSAAYAGLTPGSGAADISAAGWNLYQSGDKHDLPTFRLVFDKATTNFAYVGTTRYVLNKGTDYVPAVGDIDISNQTITVTVNLHIYAIQAANVEYTDLNALDAATAGTLADAAAKTAIQAANHPVSA